MLRGIALSVLIIFSFTILSACAHTSQPVNEPNPESASSNSPIQNHKQGEQASDAAMVADLIVIRPLGIVATIIGTVFFVVSLPFSIPGGNHEAVLQKLVVNPAKFTFDRPLGEL